MKDEMLDKSLDVFVRQAHGRHAVLAQEFARRLCSRVELELEGEILHGIFRKLP
jgi:hypothetical protein